MFKNGKSKNNFNENLKKFAFAVTNLRHFSFIGLQFILTRKIHKKTNFVSKSF